MATINDEYNTLRQELLADQASRISVLSLALTASAALLAASVQFANPYLPLFSLLLLFTARVHITQIDVGIQRIASYIRVMIEEDNPQLNWETASYSIRRASLSKQKKVWNVSSLSPFDNILFLSSAVSALLALSLSWTPTTPFYVILVITVVWLVSWIWYSFKVRELRLMKVDDREAEFWHSYKTSLRKSTKADGSARVKIHT